MVLLIRFLALILILAALVPDGAIAQSSAAGSISGRILSEEDRALHATLTLSFAAARGYPAPPRRVLTGTNGTFTFSRLPAGKYALCAQVAVLESSPANCPYVDTCAWGSGQSPIDLAAGQQLAGIVFTAPKGAWLNVRVADPDHVLPQAVPTKGPAGMGPELQLILKGPDGLYRHARFASQDNGGRDYQVAIPLKTAIGIKITSTVANPFDQSGNQIQEKDEVGVQPATPAELGPVSFTLHRKQ